MAKSKTTPRTRSASKAKPASKAKAATTKAKVATRKPKGTYVDGFVLTLPKKNRAAYKKMAELGKKVWMEHGALEYRECIGEDMGAEGEMGTTFTKVSGAQKGETVVFAWVVYKNRTHRDKVIKKVMNDPRMSPNASNNKKKPIFDMSKMAYGGFEILVSN